MQLMRYLRTIKISDVVFETVKEIHLGIKILLSSQVYLIRVSGLSMIVRVLYLLSLYFIIYRLLH
jgi:hypothetical protein